ncbi:MAG: hypothetical protein HY690_10515 [Chloroflexi bacterium]|nr:hypothetical protein [Chloroflexota bacterium]
MKSPRWEGELAEETRAKRKEHPKYINAESRAIGPVERVVYVVRKALPKLSPARVNVVVVVDDLFVSPLDLPRDYVCGLLARELDCARCANVSGVFLLHPVVYRDEVEYRALFVPGHGRSLPESAKAAFLDENTQPKAPPWLRE